ncbi:MAG: NAD(+) diphosphatase [Alphaproteobacteria bacterium]
MIQFTHRPIVYGGSRLDRAAALRRQPVRLAALQAGPQARVVPMWRSLNLIGVDSGAVSLNGRTAAAVLRASGETVFLGLGGGLAWFACDISALEPAGEGVGPDLGVPGAFRNLRDVGAVLGGEDAALLAYARGMLHWHAQHRFCGVCGAPTVSEAGGHCRRCTSGDCAAQHFPRTDPVVIMLVSDGPASGGGQCLLGRQGRWPKGLYSTLAGFVEPGETLEEAVAREVVEETGIAVASARYFDCQPWPFPSSLMLGFSARAESLPLSVDHTELEDARWFSADQIRGFAEAGFSLPRPDAIARRLVDAWLAGEI